jgi:glycosyl transferase family WbsX
MPVDVRMIAFYLPQFHPIPENDKWWGPGFTEWTNVTRARAVYKGHNQPRRPGELGYYDLRVREVRHRQAELATKYGIHGFCYYYYWFSGRRLLERPLDLMLADRDLNFPFCVCWANENWSRRWDGSENDLLMEQKHLPEDPVRFIQDLAPVLKDPRYIRVDGAPLLLVYRPDIIPNLPDVLRVWRQTAAELGIPQLHLCGVQTFNFFSGLEVGFDAMVEFPPHSIGVGEITDKMPGLSPRFKGKVYSYPEVVRYCLRRGSGVGLPVYRGLMAGWDNTARRGYNSHIFHNATPEHYEVWLRRLIEYTRSHHTGDRRLVFVNAWNEWGEGAYLEPDQKYQYRFLEATARAVFGVPATGSLIAALRQITAGDEEAQSLLTQLEQAVRINEEIVDLVDTRGMIRMDAGRDGFWGRFQPVERSGVALPQKLLSNEVTGFLDALNSPDYARGVTLHRSYDVLLMGWIASRGIEVDANSPILFQLSNLESGARYVAQVLARTRRDDVVSHLQGQRAFRQITEACSLYSGYRAYLNIAALEPGPYKLEAFVPTPDGYSGVSLPLHASIMVV